MGLIQARHLISRGASDCSRWREGSTTEGLILEAWGQGLLLGALLIMACITVSAMKRAVLLHKLILLEQILAVSSGTYCFMSFPGYGWYVSSTAALLYASYFVHNVVAWMKISPFFVSSQAFFTDKLGRSVRLVYLISLGLTIPVLLFQVRNDFRCNTGMGMLYGQLRPYEFAMRDPWWIFTNLVLLHIISKSYGISILRLVRLSPRLGVLLLAITLSLVFALLDLVASVSKGKLSGVVDGINPYWKFSLIFKCLTDAIMLDDFATELKRIGDNTIPHQPSMFAQDQNLGNTAIFPTSETEKALPNLSELPKNIKGTEDINCDCLRIEHTV